MRVFLSALGRYTKGPLDPDLAAFLLVDLTFPRPCSPIADEKWKMEKLEVHTLYIVTCSPLFNTYYYTNYLLRTICTYVSHVQPFCYLGELN